MKTKFEFDAKSGTMKPVNPMQHELQQAKPELIRQAPKPLSQIRDGADIVGGKQMKPNVKLNEQEVKFRYMSDRQVINIMDEKTGTVLCCISGYALHWAFNLKELNSVAKVEQCLDGLTKLFRNKITDAFAQSMKE